MSKNNDCGSGCSRLNRVGGQAVLEGVMMKAGSRTVTTCRKEDGSLVVTDDSFVSIRKKYKILNIPILRGVINFVEMMILSFKTLGASADALGLEEEEPSKFEKWLSEKLGLRVTDFVMIVSLILGLGLSLFLFMLLPIFLTAGINALLSLFGAQPMGDIITAVLEGIIKVGIFVAYLSLASLMPDIKRTFMYHGAEHKSIACFEHGEELTPENAKKHKRFHPRCGTSYMFFMILLGIFAGIIIKTAIPGLQTWQYTLVRILILPILMGLGYEIILLAGKHDNIVTKILSAPGLWVQRITTKEPTLDMLEVAIVSIKCALRDDFPEFKEFFDEKGWEPEVTADACEENSADGEYLSKKEEPEISAAEQAVSPAEKLENGENEPLASESKSEACEENAHSEEPIAPESTQKEISE